MDKSTTLRRLGEFLSIWGKVLLVTEALMAVLIPLGYMGLFFYFLLGMFWNIISPAMLVLRWFLTNMWGDPSNVLAFLIDLPIAVSFIIAGHILKRKYSD